MKGKFFPYLLANGICLLTVFIIPIKSVAQQKKIDSLQIELKSAGKVQADSTTIG
jgi:hypothetical protein